jgi:hypothetical protein
MGKMMGNKHTYFVEMTDTFGGEANYCWVNRFLVSASSPRGAMRRVCTRTSDSVRSVGGDRWDAVGACVCYFVKWVDPADIQSYRDNYSRIEVM